MNWAKLRRQLRREASEYLADLRNFAIALRRAEGWFTLALVLAVAFMVVVWFITGLGFDHLNQVVSALGQPRGRVCRQLTDFNAMVLTINAVMMFLIAIMALGEMMQLLNRMQRGLPKQPRKVMAPVALMLVVGVAGIAYMRHIC